MATRPSTWRVYQFRHQRAGVILAAAGLLLEQLEERDRVEEEQRRHDDRQPREVALDDVCPALRGGCEAHAAEPGVPPRVHEDQPDQAGREQHLDDGEEGDHNASRVADVDANAARERIQKLLVTGDNRLKQGVAPEKVRQTYEEALRVAEEAGLEDTVRPLVEIRLAGLAKLDTP